jgi:hypothetical protein
MSQRRDEGPNDSGPSINVAQNHGVVAGTISGPIAIGQQASVHIHQRSALANEPTAQRVVRLFLASSAELRADRDQFDLYFRQLNDALRNDNHYIEVIRWETSNQALSPTRSQDEYNHAIANCDLFVALFHTKAGAYTLEEFDVARRCFRDHGKPQVFTFFRNAEPQPRDPTDRSLSHFQAQLDQIGHFWSKYSSIESLQLQFRRQFDHWLRTSEADRASRLGL